MDASGQIIEISVQYTDFHIQALVQAIGIKM